MSHSKPFTILLATVVCATVFAVDAGAQGHRGGGGGGGGGGSHGGGGGSRGPAAGRAAPRGSVQGGGGQRVVYAPRGAVAPYRYGGYHYAPYRYAPYRYYGYGYGYRPGFSIGFYAGFPFYYPYAYAAYGYPYGAYPYAYRPYGYYPYGGYGYVGGAYAYPAGGGYVAEAYGGIRIMDAPRDAQVFLDGTYAGIVDDFDGSFQRLTIDSGPHQVEIRAPGFPSRNYDVNVQPGQTLNLHVR